MLPLRSVVEFFKVNFTILSDELVQGDGEHDKIKESHEDKPHATLKLPIS